jgi:hypothetical protein
LVPVQLPDAVQLVAFVDDHVTFDVAPDVMNAGEALIFTVGATAASALLVVVIARTAARIQERGRTGRSSARACVILRFTKTAKCRHPAVWFRKCNPRIFHDCSTIGLFLAIV